MTYVLDGSAVNNAIIPLIGAENTSNVWGYFNAPYFPTQTDATDGELPAHLDREIRSAAAGPPNIYDLIGYGCTYVLAQVIKKAGRDLRGTR